MNKSYVPLYPYSFEEANRNGDIDLYKQSHNENIACAQAIRDGISQNFDGYSLNTDFVKDIVKEYSYDRTMFVLINTIQHFDYDGRISKDNKEWAKTLHQSLKHRLFAAIAPIKGASNHSCRRGNLAK